MTAAATAPVPYAFAGRPSLRSQAERNALATANLNLVYGYLQRRFRRFAADDDVIQAGRLGLLRAAELYDPAKLFKGQPLRFSTYAEWWIRQAVVREVQARGVIHVPHRAAESCRDDAERARAVGGIGNGMELVQPASSEPAEDPRAVRLGQIEGRLCQRDRLFLERRRGGWTVMRMAAEMRVSPQRVRELGRRLVRRLRTAKEYRKGLYDGLADGEGTA